jgi:tetratricopeptide (TPR) repeat protein
MLCETIRIVSRDMVIVLVAATSLASAPYGYASQVFIGQASINQSNTKPLDLKALVERAEKLRSEAKHGEAILVWRKILAILENALKPEQLSIALALNNLGLLLSNQGQYAAAEALYRRSLAIHEKVLRPDHPDVALSLNNLAELLIFFDQTLRRCGWRLGSGELIVQYIDGAHRICGRPIVTSRLLPPARGSTVL